MSYTINSDNFTLGNKGSIIADKDLLIAGCNIEALVAGGHLVSTKSTPSAIEGEKK